jgi:hypothetical protein
VRDVTKLAILMALALAAAVIVTSFTGDLDRGLDIVEAQQTEDGAVIERLDANRESLAAHTDASGRSPLLMALPLLCGLAAVMLTLVLLKGDQLLKAGRSLLKEIKPKRRTATPGPRYPAAAAPPQITPPNPWLEE